MKPLILVLCAFTLLSCGVQQENKQPKVAQQLIDTLTVIVAHRNLLMGDSIENYALQRHPQYEIVSVRFLGIANDPECYYEVKMKLRKP